MSVLTTAVRTAIIAGAATALASCVTVFPENKPAQLYRFGAPVMIETQAAPAGSPPVGILKGRTQFAQAVAGDRMLTITGAEAAYIAEARWVAPASVLFDEALAQAFDDNPGPARLAVRSEASQAAYVLRLDVRNFEAVYENGKRAGPTAVVRVRAVLTRSADRSLAGDETFEVRVQANGNRVGAIVEAFDAATDQSISKMVDWANTTAVPPAA